MVQNSGQFLSFPLDFLVFFHGAFPRETLSLFFSEGGGWRSKIGRISGAGQKRGVHAGGYGPRIRCDITIYHVIQSSDIT
eukprot:391243-Amorphochlora_amoeboformis.AAC.1